MTWTDINPEKLAKYEGMTPVEIGVTLVDEERPSTLESMMSLHDSLSVFSVEPWDFNINNEEWNEFWHPGYQLKDKPLSDWDMNDFYVYFALSYLIIYPLM